MDAELEGPSPDVFAGRASVVAPRLLGLELWCGSRSGVIVEVEAYEGKHDPASHAWKGKTLRNESMFGPGARAYVYLSYGVHWCMNVVCGPPGEPGAILIRALEPRTGIEMMWADRPKARRQTDIASGPGKLTAALGINGSHDGANLLDRSGPVSLAGSGGSANGVVSGPRIGISRAVDTPWRFAIAANPHVSRPRL